MWVCVRGFCIDIPVWGHLDHRDSDDCRKYRQAEEEKHIQKKKKKNTKKHSRNRIELLRANTKTNVIVTINTTKNMEILLELSEHTNIHEE